MAEFRSGLPGRKRVWRITQGAPNGEYADAAPSPSIAPAAAPTPGWAMSSFDLTYGLEVTEDNSTVPAELMDELFKKPGM